MGSKNRDNPAGADRIVDAQRWLADAIDTLLEQGAWGRAMKLLDRLLKVAADTDTKLFCYENLGVLAYRSGEVREAREAFEQARDLSDADAGISYALGHCAAARPNWWRALLHYFAAIHDARDEIDRAEFMRAAAVAMQRLGFTDPALSMFMGALDRAPDNPWILESISHLYEHQERWLEALDVQEALIDVLADGLPSAEGPRPNVDRLIRRFISLWTLDRHAVERRVGAITERLRAQIGLVRDDDPGRDGADMGLMSLDLPAGLHTLVEQLAMHDRNFLLLETAQSLWARARHDRFDVHLTPFKLAAAIQAIAERLHWRVPTPADELSRLYGVEADAIVAAARMIAGRYAVFFFPEQDLYVGLTPVESRRLVHLQRALLWGVDVCSLESSLAMIGD